MNAKTSTNTKSTRANKAAKAAQAAATTPAPAPVAAVQQAPEGLAKGMVALKPGAVYRTKAAHNLEWWNKLTTVLANGPDVAKAVEAAGVPAHFIGYCTRRGYLLAGV